MPDHGRACLDASTPFPNDDHCIPCVVIRTHGRQNICPHDASGRRDLMSRDRRWHVPAFIAGLAGAETEVQVLEVHVEVFVEEPYAMEHLGADERGAAGDVVDLSLHILSVLLVHMLMPRIPQPSIVCPASEPYQAGVVVKDLRTRYAAARSAVHDVEQWLQISWGGNGVIVHHQDELWISLQGLTYGQIDADDISLVAVQCDQAYLREPARDKFCRAVPRTVVDHHDIKGAGECSMSVVRHSRVSAALLQLTIATATFLPMAMNIEMERIY